MAEPRFREHVPKRYPTTAPATTTPSAKAASGRASEPGKIDAPAKKPEPGTKEYTEYFRSRAKFSREHGGRSPEQVMAARTGRTIKSGTVGVKEVRGEWVMSYTSPTKEIKPSIREKEERVSLVGERPDERIDPTPLRVKREPSYPEPGKLGMAVMAKPKPTTYQKVKDYFGLPAEQRRERAISYAEEKLERGAEIGLALTRPQLYKEIVKGEKKYEESQRLTEQKISKDLQTELDLFAAKEQGLTQSRIDKKFKDLQKQVDAEKISEAQAQTTMDDFVAKQNESLQNKITQKEEFVQKKGGKISVTSPIYKEYKKVAEKEVGVTPVGKGLIGLKEGVKSFATIPLLPFQAYHFLAKQKTPKENLGEITKGAKEVGVGFVSEPVMATTALVTTAALSIGASVGATGVIRGVAKKVPIRGIETAKTLQVSIGGKAVSVTRPSFTYQIGKKTFKIEAKPRELPYSFGQPSKIVGAAKQIKGGAISKQRFVFDVTDMGTAKVYPTTGTSVTYVKKTPKGFKASSVTETKTRIGKKIVPSYGVSELEATQILKTPDTELIVSPKGKLEKLGKRTYKLKMETLVEPEPGKPTRVFESKGILGRPKGFRTTITEPKRVKDVEYYKYFGIKKEVEKYKPPKVSSATGMKYEFGDFVKTKSKEPKYEDFGWMKTKTEPVKPGPIKVEPIYGRTGAATILKEEPKVKAKLKIKKEVVPQFDMSKEAGAVAAKKVYVETQAIKVGRISGVGVGTAQIGLAHRLKTKPVLSRFTVPSLKQFGLMGQKVSQRPVTTPIVSVTPIVTPIVAQEVVVAQKPQVVSKVVSVGEPVPYIPSYVSPTVKPRLFIPLPVWGSGFGGGKGLGAKRKKGKQPRAYKPTLIGTLMKPQKVVGVGAMKFTGLEVRPVIKM